MTATGESSDVSRTGQIVLNMLNGEETDGEGSSSDPRDAKHCVGDPLRVTELLLSLRDSAARGRVSAAHAISRPLRQSASRLPAGAL